MTAGSGGDGRFVFPASVEGLLKGLGARVTPEFKAHLREHGLDVDKLPPAIPAAEWGPKLLAMATFSFPNDTKEEAMRKLAYAFIQGWQQTTLGSAASALLRLVGPARTLTRLDRAFRTSDNFTRAETVMVGTNEALVTINEVQGYPSYWVGILQGGLEVLGRKGTVVVDQATPPGAVLRISWQ